MSFPEAAFPQPAFGNEDSLQKRFQGNANAQPFQPVQPQVAPNPVQTSSGFEFPVPQFGQTVHSSAKKDDDFSQTNTDTDYSFGGAYDPRDSGMAPPQEDTYNIGADKKKSLRNYKAFTTICIGLGIIGMFLSVVLLGFTGILIAIVFLTVIGSFIFAQHLLVWIMDKRENDMAMQKVAQAIRQGADGYLSTQYGMISIIAVITSGVLFLVFVIRGTPPTQHTGGEPLNAFLLAFFTSLSFIVGACCSGLAGYIGVWVSVRANIRVAVCAANVEAHGGNRAEPMLIAFRGGAVAAILSAAMCILGITLLYLMSYMTLVSFLGYTAHVIPMTLAGYGFGASFVALFMQLGGGIYTKAADVGADMCGKIEKNIPEDDPRNPAVIADLVGDNVGDCAGSMADVFESIAAEIIGTMILSSVLTAEAGLNESDQIYFLFFPLIVHTIDLVVSSMGIISFTGGSKTDKNADPLALMKRSYLMSTIAAIVCFFIAARFCLYTESAPSAWLHFSFCGVTGIVTAYLLILSTQYYTDYAYGPVHRIAEASKTGDGTNVIMGISVGMESTGFPILIICMALFVSYNLGYTSGLPAHSAGVFGTACATMGMLCTAVFVLSMNNFGPIADNAGGIVEMGGADHAVRKITDQLDAVGNVTKAASKGYAVGGSALACFVLFQAFLDEMAAYMPNIKSGALHVINLAKLEVIIAGLLGIMLVFTFSGFAIAAVGKTAEKVVWEVRWQFKTIEGIMEGHALPDYVRCVRIVTQNALKEMVKPAALALVPPVLVGLIFSQIGNYKDDPFLGIEALAAFLLFTTLSALVMAIFLDNAGGAWDNAKKLIEAQDKKGTDQHKAAVTGDTVGDPFKDTAGPALHVIITTISTTILVLGPLFIQTGV